MLRHLTINRNEHILAFGGGANEAHMVSEPAFDPPTLVVIGTRAFLIIFISALESINIEFTHKASYLFKVFYQFAIR